jgi:hypothetical protein
MIERILRTYVEVHHIPVERMIPHTVQANCHEASEAELGCRTVQVSCRTMQASCREEQAD